MIRALAFFAVVFASALSLSAAEKSVAVRGEPFNELQSVFDSLKLQGETRYQIVFVTSAECSTEQGAKNIRCELVLKGGHKKSLTGRNAVKVYVALASVTGKEIQQGNRYVVRVGNFSCIPAQVIGASRYQPTTCHFGDKDAKPSLKRSN
ncbi:MAG: hypothetical protein ABL958_17975 [Bdellovibrionia bacterium]